MAEAIAAWRAQDTAAAVAFAVRDLTAFLRGAETGVCPLVYRADSYSAGNCRPGTDFWVRRAGYANRKFIPGIWLIDYLQDDRVKRVVLGMQREFTTA